MSKFLALDKHATIAIAYLTNWIGRASMADIRDLIENLEGECQIICTGVRSITKPSVEFLSFSADKQVSKRITIGQDSVVIWKVGGKEPLLEHQLLLENLGREVKNLDEALNYALVVERFIKEHT